MDSTDKLDPRYEEIVRLARELTDESLGANAPRPSGGDNLDLVLSALRSASRALAQSRATTAENESRLDELMEMTINLVGFNYSRRVTVTDKDDILDGMAVGLNMLAEELSTSTVSKAYANNIIESMSDLLVVAGPDALMKTVNQAACDLSGYSREELLGQPLSLLIPDSDSNAIVSKGGERHQERACRPKQGGSIPISFSAEVMRDNHNALQGIVCVGRDLREIKITEAERMRLLEAVQRQSIILEELSTPLIPVTKEILVMPLIGSVDAQRARRMTETLLAGIVERRVKLAIIDITGVRAVNTEAVHGIVQAVHAVRLIGAEVVLTGLRADVARTIIDLDVDLSGIVTFSALQRGILYAMDRVKGSRHGRTLPRAENGR
jgi:rsbT co-antagonist protein RsbR